MIKQEPDPEGYIPPKREVIAKLPGVVTETPSPSPAQVPSPSPSPSPAPAQTQENKKDNAPTLTPTVSPTPAAPQTQKEEEIEVAPDINKVKIGGEELTLDEIENNARVYAAKYNVQYDELSDDKKQSWMNDYISSQHMRAMEQGYRNRNEEFNRQKAAKEAEINRKLAEIEAERARQKQLFEMSKKRLEELVKGGIPEDLPDEQIIEKKVEQEIAKAKLAEMQHTEAQIDTEYNNKRAKTAAELQELKLESQIAELQANHSELITAEPIANVYAKMQTTPTAVPVDEQKKTFLILESMKKANEMGISPDAAYTIIKQIYNIGPNTPSISSASAPTQTTQPVKKLITADEFSKLSIAEQINLLKKKQKENPPTLGGGVITKTDNNQNNNQKKFDIKAAGF